MTGEKVDFGAATQQPELEDQGRKNERSTIAFPYIDIDAACEVARAVYERAGLGECELDELAAEMNQTLGGGAFRLKTTGAVTYGLAEKIGRSALKLTTLGSQLVSPDGERAARAEAFLTVPLYSAIYDAYRGQHLPPAKALEREMTKLGVASKTADKARQVFDRAANQAGFFESGDDRLVKPKLSEVQAHDNSSADAPQPPPPDDHNRRNGGGGDDGLHPFIQGLLRELPSSGSFEFSARVKWLNLAATAFDMIFDSKEKGEIKIEFKPAESAKNSAEKESPRPDNLQRDH